MREGPARSSRPAPERRPTYLPDRPCARARGHSVCLSVCLSVRRARPLLPPISRVPRHRESCNERHSCNQRHPPICWPPRLRPLWRCRAPRPRRPSRRSTACASPSSASKRARTTRSGGGGTNPRHGAWRHAPAQRRRTRGAALRSCGPWPQGTWLGLGELGLGLALA